MNSPIDDAAPVLNAEELGRYIDERLTQSAFRLELLDHYAVDTDGEDFARYLAGQPEPSRNRKQPWLDRLRREVDSGIHNHRVHVVRRPLSDYLRYECEWGYQPNSRAGEDIQILDVTDQGLPQLGIDHDFWLIDNQHAIRMNYDQAERFTGAVPVRHEQVQPYREARDLAVELADAFEQWWLQHPEQWRSHADC